VEKRALVFGCDGTPCPCNMYLVLPDAITRLTARAARNGPGPWDDRHPGPAGVVVSAADGCRCVT
jgi:hypothetical protein